MTAEQKQAVERLENGSLFNLLRSFGKHQQLSDVRALLQAVREMGEDTKRLDWLEAGQVMPLLNGAPVILGLRDYNGLSLRHSIDAAISQSGVKEG